MTAAGGLSPAAGPASPRSVIVAATVLVALALGTAALVGGWLLIAVAGFAAILVLGLILRRLDLVVALLAAEFFFNSYLAHGIRILTIDKGLGALAVAAWGLAWALNRRPVLVTRQLWLVGAFLLWTGLSIGMAVNEQAALVTSLRYVTFAVLFFLVLQTVGGDRRKADVLIRVVVVAAAVASVIGLIAFFRHHVTRASGPIANPNDFAFILASSMPLAIYQVRWAATGLGKVLASVALALIAVCTLATFSRSALVGLAVAMLWVVATGRLRLRWLAAVVVGVGAVVGVIYFLAPQLVQHSFGEKAHVATRSVDVRLGYYRVEVKEWEHYPITGVGPGNFIYRLAQFAPAAGVSEPYPFASLTSGTSAGGGEEAYLIILAEQGAVGLALFLAYLALSWGDLRRHFPNDKRKDQLQGALAAGFVVACVGALFLREQYYPPLWFLPAIGASLASRKAGAEAGGEVDLGTDRAAAETLASEGHR